MKAIRGFDHAPESVAAARRFVTGTIRGAPADAVEVIELMVSELASNCIRHSDTRFEVAVIQTDQEIRVEATDFGGGEPMQRSPEPTDPTGRGLQIVDMLSADWGFEPRFAGGKTVWFRLELGMPAAACACGSAQPAA
jgi:serine/threonine-protein kinase RsbW